MKLNRITWLLASILLIVACQSKTEKSDTSSAEASTPVVEEGVNSLTAAEKADGWQLLFDGTSTALWRNYGKETFPEEGWEIKDGALTVTKGGGDLITKEKFGNFELSIDFNVTKGANSGIFYFVMEEDGKAIWNNSPEFQVIDDQDYIDREGLDKVRTHLSGDNYDLQAAPGLYSKPAGEWNNAKITQKDGVVTHYLNGNQTCTYDVNSEEWATMVAKSKFKDYENYGKTKEGNIGLQDHGDEVAYRNIKIRTL